MPGCKNCKRGEYCDNCRNLSTQRSKKYRENKRKLIESEKTKIKNNIEIDQEENLSYANINSLSVEQYNQQSVKHKTKHAKVDTDIKTKRNEIIERKTIKQVDGVVITEEIIKAEETQDIKENEISVQQSYINSLRVGMATTIQNITKIAQEKLNSLKIIFEKCEDQKTIKCDLLKEECEEFLDQSLEYQKLFSQSYYDFMKFKAYKIIVNQMCPIVEENNEKYFDFDAYFINKNPASQLNPNIAQNQNCLVTTIKWSNSTNEYFSYYRLLSWKMLKEHGCFATERPEDHGCLATGLPKSANSLPILVKINYESKLNCTFDEGERTKFIPFFLNKDLYRLNETIYDDLENINGERVLYILNCTFKFISDNNNNLPVQVSISLPTNVLMSIKEYKPIIYNFFRNHLKNHQNENIENQIEQDEFISEYCDEHDRETQCEKIDEQGQPNPMFDNLQEYLRKITNQ